MTRELDARLLALPTAVIVYRLLALCRVLVELALSDRQGDKVDAPKSSMTLPGRW
jgi:hypothetical protein